VIRLFLKKHLLKQEIERNIAPELEITVTRDELVACLSWDSGFDSSKCKSFVEHLTRDMHDMTLEKTLGVSS
jgi:hypothetical protein